MSSFKERMNGRDKPVIGVIGLGYVGLPLAMEFALGGCRVLGIDVDPEKPVLLEKRKSYLKHFPDEKIAAAMDTGLLEATTDFSVLGETDAILIAVPTPLGKSRQPDLSFVLNSCREVARYLTRGQLIILESTTYPGTTREEMIPVLEESGLKAGKDFHIAFSPEREDPGNKNFNTRTIPKLVGGFTPRCTDASVFVYGFAIDNVVPVSSPEVAEMAKIMENTYRAVNIALVNELKVLAHRMGIDIWEVINAAATKPFGFTPFYPGPGLGGHCIPIDPFYLTWKAHQYELPTKFIELAGEVNTSMPSYVVDRVCDALNDAEKSLKGSRVLLLGMAYKPNIDDYRETPALKVMHKLMERGAEVDYNDPFIPSIPPATRQTILQPRSVELSAESLACYDCCVVITDHDCYDYQWIVDNSSIVVDTRNACVDVVSEKRIYKA
ncbi:UDP-N-acetyl-D-glucosamine dehydrogenase [Candidatus Fermentibacteria bacterium]|nr:MAG: UDP-N-acetyl-D-glucosamine dehydrogenase [Candidatus Fermentibacteria bacterium]